MKGVFIIDYSLYTVIVLCNEHYNVLIIGNIHHHIRLMYKLVIIHVFCNVACYDVCH